MDSQDGFCEYSREVENKNIFCTSINIHLSIVPALCNLNASLDIASATKYSKSDCEKINALKKGSWNVTAIEVEISICQKSSLHLLGFSQTHLWVCFLGSGISVMEIFICQMFMDFSWHQRGPPVSCPCQTRSRTEMYIGHNVVVFFCGYWTFV